MLKNKRFVDTNMNKNSKIYIAGHRGLVGSSIVRNLQSQGFTNLLLRTHAELDLTSQAQVSDFFAKERPDYVILAAAKVGGIYANNKYRADFIYDNLMMQNNVIHNSYLSGVKKLLFLGSSCIYPKNALQPLKEDCLLTSELEYTNEPYAIAKIAGIKMCESYNLQYGTNFISVMPTNLYGPYDNFDLETSHVLPAMIRKIHLAKLLQNNDYVQIIKNLALDPLSEKIVVDEILLNYGIVRINDKVVLRLWGSGRPYREFLHSDDMASACVFVMQNINFSDLTSKMHEVRNTHINIGTGKDITISDLAKLISQIIDYTGVIEFDTTKPDGTMRKLQDVSKFSDLGWNAQIDLEHGLREVIAWYLTTF